MDDHYFRPNFPLSPGYPVDDIDNLACEQIDMWPTIDYR